MKNNNSVKNAFIDTLPVLAGYLVLGMGFGIIMKSSGYGFLWAFCMSAFIYAGSMQYAAIGLITGGASLVTVFITTLAVNMRHIFYGISMIDKYKGMGKIKPYLIFSLTDETYSIVSAKSGDKNYYFFVSFFDHLYWISGTVIGSILGSALKFNTDGISFALTALFITVFIEQWLSSKDKIPAIAGITATLFCRLIFGAESFLIPSMIVIFLFLMLKMKKEEKSDER